MVEINTVLGLWLTEVPAYTASLCRIVVLAFLIDKLTIGYVVAVAAKGQIAGYQSTIGGMLILAPFIAWLAFSLGCGVVWSIGSALIITRTMCALGRVWWVKRLMNVPMHRWFDKVLARCLLSIVLPVLVALLITKTIEATVVRVLISTAACSITLAGSVWLLGFDIKEKKYILDLAEKVGGLLPQKIF